MFIEFLILIFFLIVLWLFVFYYQKGFFLYSKYGLPNIFLIFVFLITTLSIAWYQIESRKNVSYTSSHIIFVLDVSKSMWALDYQDETRLQMAKNFIREYILKYPNNTYALTIFAQDITSVIPFTTDKNLFFTFLDSVDEQSILNQWSNFFDAISEASTRFTDEVNGWGLVVLSDFEPTDTNGNIDTRQKETLLTQIGQLFWDFQEKNIRFFWVGFWNISWNTIMAWYDIFGNPMYLQDTFKKNIITKLDRDFLEKITQKLSWKYFIVNQPWDIKNIAFENLPELNSDEIQNVPIDMARYLMMIAFIFLIVYFILFYYFDKKWK